MATVRKIALQQNLSEVLPLIAAVREQLTKLVAPDGGVSADFGAFWFLAPTLEAGRILRETVAEGWGGVVSFRTDQPERILQNESEATENRAMLLAKWSEVLLSVDPASCPELFRNNSLGNYRSRPLWLWGTATELQSCRKEIMLGMGLSLGEFYQLLAKKRTRDNFAPDLQLARFAEMLELEKAYLARFAAGKEPVAAALQVIRAPELPDPAIEKVVLIDCTELKNGVIRALEALDIEVEVWIDATPDELAFFDDWGRPLAECWLDRPIPVGLDRIRQFATPGDQAEKLARLLEECRRNRHGLPSVAGVLDPEILPPLLECLRERAIPAYAPERRKLGSLPWAVLLQLLLELGGESPGFETAAQLARNGLYSYYLRMRNPELKTGAMLDELDKIQEEHLYGSFSDLEHIKATIGANAELLLTSLQTMRRRMLDAENLLECAWSLVAELGGEIPSHRIDFALAEMEIGQLKQLLEQIFAVVPSKQQPEMLRFLLRETEVDIRSDHQSVLDLAGFLELPWRSDSTLIIAGVNEESFQQGSPDDAFLPDRLREELGMPCMKSRHVADCCRFFNLARSRNLFVLYGKGSSQGDVLRPARLLLQCALEELPGRAAALFGGELEETVTRSFPVNGEGRFPPYLPRLAAMPGDRMSVSSFQSYLKCPFQFYRERILRARERHDRNLELDPMHFGTLLHRVLEEFGRLEGAGQDPEKTIFFCDRILERVARTQLGSSPNSIVQMQLEIMRKSLGEFAVLQAELAREEEFGIFRVEQPVGPFPWQDLFGKLFPEAPLEPWRKEVQLSGKIDRIDRFFWNGRWHYRVIDYKSARTMQKPQDTHLTGKPTLGNDPDASFACMVRKNKAKGEVPAYWSDLQLPLYLLILRHINLENWSLEPDAEFSAGYVNLPLAYSETGYAPFDELSDEATLKTAARCADAVLRAIFLSRIFWPPREKGTYFDRFYQLLHFPETEDFAPGDLEGVK